MGRQNLGQVSIELGDEELLLLLRSGRDDSVLEQRLGVRAVRASRQQK